MHLEKRNEIVWSIKRKTHPGNFMLRAAEESGKIVKVGIGLADGQNEVEFKMNYAEFQNFYGIVSSFKELIETPGNLVADAVSNQQPAPTSQTSGPKPMSLDGTGVPLSLNANGNTTQTVATQTGADLQDADVSLQDIDEGLASLNDLDKGTIDKGIISPVGNKPQADASWKPPTGLVAPLVPISNEPEATPIAIESEKIPEIENESKLKETDWDPW